MLPQANPWRLISPPLPTPDASCPTTTCVTVWNATRPIRVRSRPEADRSRGIGRSAVKRATVRAGITCASCQRRISPQVVTSTSPSRGLFWHPTRRLSGSARCHGAGIKSSVLDPESPSAIRFQGTTLTRSRCYIESDMQLDCVTCHNPHRDAETSTKWYESRCLQCHSPAGAPSNHKGSRTNVISKGRVTSCPVQPATGCIACHMPKRKSAVAHTAFTDHFIRVHRELEAE